MSVQPVLIAGKWQTPENALGTFTADNPATKSALPDAYPISGLDEIEGALQAGQEAVSELRAFSAEQIAQFLDLFATNTEARADEREALKPWNCRAPSINSGRRHRRRARVPGVRRPLIAPATFAQSLNR
jgi:acyl-CoA reductase-like NAD-dependent aldehyde dehydrogenase